MDVSATFGRVIDTVITGTSNLASYTVPSNRVAIIQAGMTSGTQLEIVVATKKYQAYESFGVLAFADQGESVDITFTSASSPHYQILLYYRTTLV